MKNDEARVMTLEEVKALPIGTRMFYEGFYGKGTITTDLRISRMNKKSVAYDDISEGGYLYSSSRLPFSEYGKYWRVWNAQPTTDLILATPWNNKHRDKIYLSGEK